MPPDVYRELWAERDRRWAERLHRAARHRSLVWLLLGVSWLGDGALWYVTLVALALTGGTDGRDVAAQMLLVGIFNLSLYLWLKARIGRPRPYVKCPGIHACGRALDQFSFPSGHALHASAFTVLLVGHYPDAAWLLVPTALLVCFSRIALGLHYPSDVAAGALIGAASAALMLGLY
jgi:undecaprenyl-diphosphatase